MKLIFVFIFAFFLNFQGTNLEEIRTQYPKASSSKTGANNFAALVNQLGNDAVSTGYKSAAKIIQAKFENGPNRKNLITSGIKSLENVIKTNPRNIELRVIRLSIQENLPKIVGYSSKIKEDKALISQNYASQNTSLKAFVRSFVMNSKSFTPTEKKNFK